MNKAEILREELAIIRQAITSTGQQLSRLIKREDDIERAIAGLEQDFIWQAYLEPPTQMVGLKDVAWLEPELILGDLLEKIKQLGHERGVLVGFRAGYNEYPSGTIGDREFTIKKIPRNVPSEE